MIYFITIFVMLVIVVILEVMIKKDKIERKSKAHRYINLIGVIIPLILITVHYFYFQTDTVVDWIITSTLSLLVIVIVYVANKYFEKSDKYYYFVPVVLGLFTVIYILILQHMLNYLPETTLFGLCGAVIGTVIKKVENNKIPKIGISILAVITLMFIFNTEIIDSKKQIKPVRKVMEYVELNGYKTYRNDFYYVGSMSKRNTPIRITLYSIPGEKRITDEFKFEYYKGQVVEDLHN